MDFGILVGLQSFLQRLVKPYWIGAVWVPAPNRFDTKHESRHRPLPHPLHPKETFKTLCIKLGFIQKHIFPAWLSIPCQYTVQRMSVTSRPQIDNLRSHLILTFTVSIQRLSSNLAADLLSEQTNRSHRLRVSPFQHRQRPSNSQTALHH